MTSVGLHIICRTVLTLAVGGLCGTTVQAQPYQPLPAPPIHFTDTALQFERLDSRKGLSHNTVLSILQDHDGYVWVGTSDGLNRYDGYTFTSYRHDPTDTTTLSDNAVQVLFEDRDGVLWVGTATGLNRREAKTGRFRCVALAGMGCTESIHALAQDEVGALWVSTYSGKLYRHDPISGTVTLYFDKARPHAQPIKAPTQHLPSHTIVHLFESQSGRLWVQLQPDALADPDVIYEYDVEGDGFRAIARPAGLDEGRIKVSDTGVLWVPDASLAAHTAAPGWIRPLPNLGGAHVNDWHLFDDQAGRLWIGTEQGLYVYDPATKAHRQYFPDAQGTATLSNYVRTVYQDRAGALWVGTRGGLFRYDPHLKPFTHLGPGAPLPEGGGNTVMALHEDHTGSLWIGTLGGGLLRLDGHTNTLDRYRQDEAVLPNNNVWAIQQISGRLWLGTNDGLCALEVRTRRCKRVPIPPSRIRGLTTIYTLALDQGGYLWAGGDDDIYQIDPASGQIVPDRHHEALGTVNSVQVLHFDQGQPHVLWVGTAEQGLKRYDTRADAWTSYPYAASAPAALPGKSIWTIHQDSEGLLWLGTDLGLAQFDPATASFTAYYDPAQQPGGIVYSLLEDTEQRLWMGTNRGLLRFDKHTGQLRHYDTEDGIGNSEYNRQAALQASTGEMLFGGLNGITAFTPAAILDNPYRPPIVITRAWKANRDTTITLYPQSNGHLVLSYRDYSFSFEFAALNFTNPQKNRYAYRLEGFDEQWVAAGVSRSARYTNIPPGRYVFRVKGTNNDGLWNEAGAALHLTITPLFWQRGWFRGLMVLLGVGVLAALYRYRIRRLLEIERIRLRIATDLHDDIGGDLSSIALLSDMVRDREHLTEQDRRKLDQVSHAAREMVETLREIVWAINPANDAVSDLVEHMRDTASVLLDGATFTLDVNQDTARQALSMEARRHLFLIYKEALHNIARHARATRVQVHLRATRDQLCLRITDDGVGFDPAVARGNGLRHLHQRAAQIGGTLMLESQPGHGTTIQLTTSAQRRWRKTA